MKFGIRGLYSKSSNKYGFYANQRCDNRDVNKGLCYFRPPPPHPVFLNSYPIGAKFGTEHLRTTGGGGMYELGECSCSESRPLLRGGKRRFVCILVALTSDSRKIL